MYDLVVIGAGSAGLTAAAFAGELGAKVVLIEKEAIGGDCTWFGCVPSKTLLNVAKHAHHARTGAQYGIHSGPVEVDMKAVKDHIQAMVARIYEHETPEEVSKRGVEVVEGEAVFLDAKRVQVGDRVLESRKFIVASGATASVPPIPGLSDISYFTNHNLFGNERLPKHFVVLGAGAIGLEMAQAYRRLGAEVTVIGAELLPRDDEDARVVIRKVFAREGIKLIEANVVRFEKADAGFVAYLESGEGIEGDMLLVAVGRSPRVEGLGLDKAGVTYSRRGIQVDKYLRTSVPHILAIGDCTEGPKLTHYAGFQGSVAGRNALFPWFAANGHTDLYPWTTFTDPEIAQIGLTEEQAKATYPDQAKVFHFPLTDGDRSMTDSDTDGYIKIMYKGSGDVLGVSIVAARAGEMITEYALLMSNKMRLRQLVSTIHAYPTYSDVVRSASSRLLIKELFSGFSGRVIRFVSRLLWSSR